MVATLVLAAAEPEESPTAEDSGVPAPIPQAPQAAPPPLLPVPIPGGGARPFAPGGGNGGTAAPENAPPPEPRHDFVSDRIAQRMLERAREKLAEEEYRDAVRLLQAVLDRPQDGLILTDPQSGRFQSARAVADGLLGELSPEGRRVYELQFGLGARHELEKAITAGDWSTIAEISERYYHTKAGMEAAFRVAIRAIDRGEPLVGALMLDRLRQAGAEQFQPQLTMRLLLAARLAGMEQLAASARTDWESFAARGRLEEDRRLAGGVRRRFTHWLANPDRGRGVSDQSIWSTLTGSRDGTITGRQLTVAGGAVWTYTFDGSDSPAGTYGALDRLVGRAVDQAVENAASMGDIMLPASSPVIVGRTVVFRTVRDLRAVDLASGRLLWRSAQPHRLLFDHVFAKPEVASLFDREFQHRQSQNLATQVYLAQHLWRNMARGMITTDGRRVYAIAGTGLGQSDVQIVGGSRIDGLHEIGKENYNTLIAYDLSAEGRIAWMLGGPPESSRTTGLYFLGPPLPVGHRLFALAEKDGQILLVALDPSPQATERILWRQPLAASETFLDDDPLRRISGLMPSFSRGILACPTGTGAIIAVDLRNRTIHWAYRYQRRDVIPGPGRFGAFGGWRLQGLDGIDRRQRWIDCVPRIAGSRVLVTPRDSNELHCLDLETGELLWSRPRGEFLYVGAVVDERVILVGSEEIAALAIQAGSDDPLWRLPLDVDQKPAGRGLLSGDIYYWPTKGGTICALDWRTGRMLGEAKVGGDSPPGNLAATGGRLVSLSGQAIVGFRNVHFFDKSDKPTNAEMLALRGEHRLMHGELADGVAALRQAIDQGVGARARELLLRTLLEGLRRDFSSFQQYAGELKGMLTSPAERVEFAEVYAEGLAGAGKPVRAAKLLLDTVEFPRALDEYRQVSADRRVRVDRLIRAQIGRIYAGADDEARQEIDAMVEGRSDLLALQFRSQPGPGNVTQRLRLLTTIAYGTGVREKLLEELRGQLQNSGQELRARLVGMELTRITDEKDESEETPAGDGEPAPTPRPTPGARRSKEGAFPATLEAYYQADPADASPRRRRVETTLPIRLAGPVPARFEGWRFRTDATRRELIAQDAAGRERWRIPIDVGSREGLPRSVDQFRARFCGPLLAVCADSLMAVFETNRTDEPPRLLWSKNLSISGEIRFQNILRAPGAMQVNGPPSARFGFAGPRVVLLNANHRTMAVDSVTGELLWSVAGDDFDRTLLGNSECVALAGPPGYTLVRRTADGALVERRMAKTNAAAIATLGSRMIRWDKTKAGFALVCLDVITQSPLWRFDFPQTVMPRYVGHDAVAVFDPVSGHLQLIRWTDGKRLWETEIEPNSDLQGFRLLPAGENYLLFTQDPSPPQLPQMPRLGRPWMSFSGTVRGLDAEGQLLWGKELKFCEVHQGLPRALPLLVTVEKARVRQGALGSIDQWTLRLIDARTGKPLIETRRGKTFAPLAIEADSSARRIEIRVPMGRFVVEPAEGVGDGTS